MYLNPQMFGVQRFYYLCCGILMSSYLFFPGVEKLQVRILMLPRGVNTNWIGGHFLLITYKLCSISPFPLAFCVLVGGGAALYLVRLHPRGWIFFDQNEIVIKDCKNTLSIAYFCLEAFVSASIHNISFSPQTLNKNIPPAFISSPILV